MNAAIALFCLPGRLAVLVPDASPQGGIVVPEAIRQRYLAMDRPPYPLVRGEVVAAGAPRGRVVMPRVGDEVWVYPRAGLIVEADDIDIPSLGRQVPAGHTLRLYGVGDDWFEQVALAKDEGANEEAETG